MPPRGGSAHCCAWACCGPRHVQAMQGNVTFFVGGYWRLETWLGGAVISELLSLERTPRDMGGWMTRMAYEECPTTGCTCNPST